MTSNCKREEEKVEEFLEEELTEGKKREFELKECFDKLLNYEKQRASGGGSLDKLNTKERNFRYNNKNRPYDKNGSLDRNFGQIMTERSRNNYRDRSNKYYKMGGNVTERSPYKEENSFKTNITNFETYIQTQRTKGYPEKSKKRKITSKEKSPFLPTKSQTQRKRKKSKENKYYKITDINKFPITSQSTARDRMKAYDNKRKIEEETRAEERVIDTLRSEYQKKQAKNYEDLKSRKALKLERELNNFREKAIKRKRTLSRRKKEKNWENGDFICSINIKKIEEDGNKKKKLVGELVVPFDKGRSEITENLTKIFQDFDIIKKKNNTRELRAKKSAKVIDSLKDSLENFKNNEIEKLKNLTYDNKNNKGNISTRKKGYPMSTRRSKKKSLLDYFEEIEEDEGNSAVLENYTSNNTEKRGKYIDIGKYKQSNGDTDISRESLILSENKHKGRNRRWNLGLNSKNEGGFENPFNQNRREGGSTQRANGSHIEEILGHMYKNNPIENEKSEKFFDVKEPTNNHISNINKEDDKSFEIEVSILEEKDKNFNQKLPKASSNDVTLAYNKYIGRRNSPGYSKKYSSPYSKKSLKTKKKGKNGLTSSPEELEKYFDPEEKKDDTEEYCDFRIFNLDSQELLEYYKEVRIKGNKDFYKHQKRQCVKGKIT